MYFFHDDKDVILSFSANIDNDGLIRNGKTKRDHRKKISHGCSLPLSLANFSLIPDVSKNLSLKG